MDKKAQTTIFIIVGIIIVASILLFFIFRKTVDPDPGGLPDKSANQEFMEACLRDTVYEKLTSYLTAHYCIKFFTHEN